MINSKSEYCKIKNIVSNYKTDVDLKSAINQSELIEIIRNIFRGIMTPKLERTFNEIYNGKINQIYHKENIEQIDRLAKNTYKSKILSMVSIAKRPIIDINVQISVTQLGEIKYSIFGSDLRKYHMYLPKIHDDITGQIHRPMIGTKNSRWYPDYMALTMKNISLHLRMLDLYLKNNKIIITQNYTTSPIGILGLEVPLVIPEIYSKIFQKEEIRCDSNPIKKSPGIFIFGKNKISSENLDLMAKKASTVIGFEHVYSLKIKDPESLLQFISSPQTIAIGVWNRHAKIIIKQKEKKIIEILDPWKQHIEKNILNQFNIHIKNYNWNVIFICRQLKDQVVGEDSCVLVAFARLLYLASIEKESYGTEYYNKPIPDFFAFLASYLYKKIK